MDITHFHLVLRICAKQMAMLMEEGCIDTAAFLLLMVLIVIVILKNRSKPMTSTGAGVRITRRSRRQY
jgi:hypothetical protein